ncbi:hypothetical protein LTR95_010770 [Oleoguttula sp. CCFEE 5521]
MPSNKSPWEDQAAPLNELYRHIGSHDMQVLLETIQRQSTDLAEGSIKIFLIPLCLNLVALTETMHSEAQECIGTLVKLYLERVIGREPAKPFDWARPDEVSTPKPLSLKCGCVEKIDTFLLDCNATSLEIACQSSSLSWSFSFFEYFEPRDGHKAVNKITKTLKWWTERHKAWEERASDALAEVKRIPEPILARCLADQYRALR